jgi:hypothetical protein
MRKVLIAMDGSRNAMRALDYVFGPDGRQGVTSRP